MDYNAADDFAEKLRFVESFDRSVSHLLGRSDWLRREAGALTALEIGGAGGISAGLCSEYFRRVICSDIVDHQKKYDGEFARRLYNKFQANGHALDYGKVEFHVASAMDLPYRDDYFDSVYSLNAFEHIPDPVLALKEAIRVVKPGGVIYISFNPIWTAHSGSHFLHLVNEPWRHLLIGQNEFVKEMVMAGGTQSQVQDFISGLNRKLPATFRDELRLVVEDAGITDSRFYSWGLDERSDMAAHPNRMLAAKHLGIPAADLLIQGFSCVMTK